MNLRYTTHARDRMAEMNISPAVIESIVRFPSMTRPSRGRNGMTGAVMAVSDKHPDYAVVYHPNLPMGPAVVITIVFRTYHEYDRRGDRYEPKE